MPFPDELLLDDEHLAVGWRPHWIEIVSPMIWLVAIVVSWLVLVGVARARAAIVLASMAAAIGVFIALAKLAERLQELAFDRYAVTNHRAIIRKGVLARDSQDVPLQKIHDIRLRQSLLARTFGAGHLELQSAATAGFVDLPWVPQAEQVRRTLHQLARDARGPHTGDDVSTPS